VLTKAEALKLVSEKLKEISSFEDPFIVVDDDTIERSFGWVFFYNSKKYLETKVFRYRLAGNGPAIVNKYDGTVEFFGSAKDPAEYIEEYESKWRKNNGI